MAITLSLLALAAVSCATDELELGHADTLRYASGFPPDNTADQPFVCDYRALAWEFAKKVQPEHDTRLTFDALMLGSLCNQTRPLGAPAARPVMQSGCSAFVAVDGDDSNAGTSWATAKKTVAAGIAVTRKQSAPRKLCIGNGTFFLSQTVALTSKDSHLSIAGAGGTWFSGAKNVPALQWEQYKVSPATHGTLQSYNNTDNQKGCTPGDASGSGGCGCLNISQLSVCQARCDALGPAGCNSFAWSGIQDGHWSNQCCIHTDGVWQPQTGSRLDNNHVAGRWVGATPARNVWKATLPSEFSVIENPQLRVGGARSPRARFPNSNPETDIWPTGWVPDAQTWLPAKPPKSKPQYIGVLNKEIQSRNDGLDLNSSKPYSGGIGGPCEVFDPPFSYWCSAHPAGGGGFQYYVPSGMVLPSGPFPEGAAPSGWAKQGKGATVQAFRRSHWASWMFDVDSVAAGPDGVQTVKFGRGGYQGCRGGPGQDWYVENVLELLDSPNEHYVDLDTDPPTIYYQPNATSGSPPSDLGASVPRLKTLLAANASQADPIVGLSITGIGFRDAAPTYMDPHGVPSGGDWALERMGALYIEGSIGLSIDDCQFERLDGNAIMLSGFNRAASVTKSHFAWTGGTAVAAWGRTDEIGNNGNNGWDATAGDIPAGTVIADNIMRESGIWEKQSSCFFQAKTAATTLLRNLCFNLPRAGFNFNDGLGGGDEVHSNLIFNSCRETSDHGPINSWDRQPYVSTFGALPGPTAHMKTRNISYNFLVANYGGSNGAVDNDDQSLRYDNNHNFQVYGHQKFKTGVIRSFGNVIAYASGFGEKWKSPGTIVDEPNVMYDNKVWFTDNAQYHNDDSTAWVGNRSYNNALVGLNVTMGGKNEDLQDWQNKNPEVNDVGSTYQNVKISTEAAKIIAAARELLDL